VFGEVCFYAGDEDVLDIGANCVEHAFVGLFLCDAFGCSIDEFVVLSRYDDGLNAHGVVVFVVFDSYLALRVGTEVCHELAFATDGSEFHDERVAESECQGDVEGSFVCCVTEHHALVTGALLCFVFAFHTAIDVGALFVESGEDAAGRFRQI